MSDRQSGGGENLADEGHAGKPQWGDGIKVAGVKVEKLTQLSKIERNDGQDLAGNDCRKNTFRGHLNGV